MNKEHNSNEGIQNLEIQSDQLPEIRPDEKEKIEAIEKSFIESYMTMSTDESISDWLQETLKSRLPEVPEEEIANISHDIIHAIEVNNEKLGSIQTATSRGIGKESWFAREVTAAADSYEEAIQQIGTLPIIPEVNVAASMASGQQAAKYLQNLDDAVRKANDALTDSITTKAGTINMNPQLDGFIAEQYHAQTFNMNAEATGSPYRAEVLKPVDGTYGKNSVDIVIKDDKGNIVRRYQCKYCKDADATKRAFESGDYRGQQKLVPSDQNEDVNAKTTDHIEAPDGTSSNPLTKEKAKQMQEEAQSGHWNDLNWNEYKLRDIAVGIGKQAGRSALLGIGIGFGTSVVKQAIENHGTVDLKKASLSGLKSGGEFGLKAILAASLKVASEKGLITIIPKGTPAGTIANIVHVAIENMKVITRIASGELTLEEGINEMEKVTLSTIAGIAAGTKGALIGAEVGAFAGPIGVALGGFVGATVGYIIGSGITEKIVSVTQRLRNRIFKAVWEETAVLSDEIKESSEARKRWYAEHPLLA